MRISTDGLILREQNIGEQNRLVTVLTRSHGVVRAFVRNCRSLKSPKGAATRLLCYSRLVIFAGRDTYTIDEAQSEEMFIPLRNDVVKMSLAQYFCELALHFVPENLPAGDYLRLLLNALYLLSRGMRPAALVKAAVELRMLTLGGYMPDLICCESCKCYEHEKMHFLPKRGVLLCGDCLKKNGEYSILLGMGVTTAMRHCVYAEFDKLFQFTLPPESISLLERASEEYLLHISEKNFKTLDFYKTIRD